ncbi:hypothetical protein ABBQ38_011699 [Trebouxia sp. C0009 RCD-2024]
MSSQSLDGEDFELRQLAWTNLTQLLRHNPAGVSSQARSFFRVLLQYIQPDNGYKDWPLHWTHPQLSVLRQVALCTLHSMAPSFPKAYEECGGPVLILQFLAGCSDSNLLETGLHHMHQACTASPLLCATWAGQGSMELALAVAADSTWPGRVRRSALLLISVLCRGSTEAAQQFLQLEGVGCLCLELEKLKLVGHEAASLYDFAVLDALWSGIVQSPAALQCFLLADGLGSLLDLLDQAAAALRQLLLTIIADVLGSDSGKHIQATDLFYEWVSSRQQSAGHVILELWRQEEGGRGVASPYCMTCQQRSTCLSPRLAAAAVGTASKNSSDTLYMKVHAIFSQLGFPEAASHVDLPDRATLCAVEHYIALHQGIIWQNMADKFAAEGLDPTEEDQLRIKDNIKRAAGIRRSVKEQQQALLQAHADQLMQAELDFVRAKRAQDERDAEARRYHKDMSNLTVKERLAAKAKREQMLLESFAKEEEAFVFEDGLALEDFSRRPSHAAQDEAMERLTGSPSQAVHNAADLLRKQCSDQKMETRMHSPRSTARGVGNNLQVERRLSDFTGMEGDASDYDDLQRDSASDESDDEGYESD